MAKNELRLKELNILAY